MASDDLCEGSSTTQQLAWELPVFDSSLYPAPGSTYDNTDFRWLDQTVPFHWTGHSDVITPTLPSTYTQGTYGLNPSISIDYNSHYPPLQMADTTPLCYSEPIPSHPSSHVTPQEISPMGSLMSYPYGAPSIREVNLQPSALSLSTSNTLPSLCEPGHPVGSTSYSAHLPEYNFLPLLGDIDPVLWAGPGAFEQEFHQELTAAKNWLAAAPISYTPTLTTALNKTGAVEPHRLRPPVEELQTNSGEIFTNNQIVDKCSSPTSPAAGRKRKRVPNISSVADRSSKRRNGVRDGATLNVKDLPLNASTGSQSYRPPSEAPMNNTTSVIRSLLCQPRSSHVMTPPTTTEMQTLEPTEDNHDTRQANGGEFFREATNTVIKDSKMTAIGVQLVYARGDHSNGAAALQWLKGRAMRGAEHDSADRDPPPRCHPGTRTTITQKIQDWLGNSEREKNLLWLRGTAGVGKSAIVQTVAESLSETGRLGASLFFSRPNGRSNPRQILPTLAYRFAVQDPSYREYIAQLKHTDPESLDKAMGEQFRILIVDPFVRKGLWSGKVAWAVTLDGLDECGEDPNGRRHSNDVQRDVVRLISDFVQQYPTAPLIWIIASRPEVHLKAVFSELDVVPSFWEEDVPVDSTEACEDAERFLHKEFREIGQKYPGHIRQSPWPTHKQFLRIAHAALGLFIFAESVVRFIGDPEVGNPIGQLECVLVAISETRSKNQQNPLANLDAIYLAILSKIPRSTLPITKRLLGFLIFLNRKAVFSSECNFDDMCQMLDISKDTGITTLRHLHSVLYFDRDFAEARPSFYHASFRDFLEDKSRSHEYFLDNPVFTLDQFIQDLVRDAQAQFSSDPDSPLSDENEPDGRVSKFVENIFREGEFSPNGVHVRGDFSWVSPLPDALIQPLLESLNVFKVWKYAGIALCRSQKDNLELSRRGFLSCTTFGSLGIDWDTVSMSHISGCHIRVDTTLGIQTEPQEDCPGVQEFRRLAKAAGSDEEGMVWSEKVNVWGHRKSGCRLAVVDLMVSPTDGVCYAVSGIPFVTT